MALIIAVCASVIGFVSGLVSIFVLGAPLLTGIAVYFSVSFALIGSYTLAVVARGGLQTATGATAEDMLDDAWMAHAKPMTAEEAAFQTELDTPLTESARATGQDRDSA